MIIEFKDPMDRYGTKKTDEWYQRHVRRFCLGEIYAPLYAVDSYEGEIWFPYELNRDFSPADGPYATFDTPEKAIECIKRMGGVYVEDCTRVCKELNIDHLKSEEMIIQEVSP